MDLDSIKAKKLEEIFRFTVWIVLVTELSRILVPQLNLVFF